MNAIINIGPSLPAAPDLTRPPVSVREASHTADADDSVELSRFGRALARATAESSFRLARARAIRAEIAAGTYETPERLHGTIERLLDVVI